MTVPPNNWLVSAETASIGPPRSARCAPCVVLCIVIAAASATQCSAGPSLNEFVRTLREAAGPGAHDCGVIPLSKPRQGAISCAQNALTQGRAFTVAFQLQGIDSTIYMGLARDANGKTERLSWDSDVFGGARLFAKPQIFRRPCQRPSLKDSGAAPIGCEEK